MSIAIAIGAVITVLGANHVIGHAIDWMLSQDLRSVMPPGHQARLRIR